MPKDECTFLFTEELNWGANDDHPVQQGFGQTMFYHLLCFVIHGTEYDCSEIHLLLMGDPEHTNPSVAQLGYIEPPLGIEPKLSRADQVV